MKITPQILSIPPYISTAWRNIASLHVEGSPRCFVLIVTLLSGTRIEVPQLDPSTIETIFAAHARHLEQDERPSQPGILPKAPMNFPVANGQLISFELPLKGGLADIENFGTLLQHNPEQASGPSLPPEVIEKITLLAKSMGIDETNAIPKPEPDCNCMRCQIAGAMLAGIENIDPNKEEPEEIVSDDELKFKNWDIEQIDEKLFTVTNPLDKEEHYNVFLGEPIGCTCGANQCDHIQAVLYTS